MLGEAAVEEAEECDPGNEEHVRDQRKGVPIDMEALHAPPAEALIPVSGSLEERLQAKLVVAVADLVDEVIGDKVA